MRQLALQRNKSQAHDQRWIDDVDLKTRYMVHAYSHVEFTQVNDTILFSCRIQWYVSIYSHVSFKSRLGRYILNAHHHICIHSLTMFITISHSQKLSHSFSVLHHPHQMVAFILILQYIDIMIQHHPHDLFSQCTKTEWRGQHAHHLSMMVKGRRDIDMYRGSIKSSPYLTQHPFHFVGLPSLEEDTDKESISRPPPSHHKLLFITIYFHEPFILSLSSWWSRGCVVVVVNWRRVWRFHDMVNLYMVTWMPLHARGRATRHVR